VGLKTEQECSVCEEGIGHEVDIGLYDPPSCCQNCFVCRTELRLKSQHSVECCGHRYVGEDLFRADAYYGKHDVYGSDEWD
jgi:hypothetical protein